MCCANGNSSGKVYHPKKITEIKYEGGFQGNVQFYGIPKPSGLCCVGPPASRSQPTSVFSPSAFSLPLPIYSTVSHQDSHWKHLEILDHQSRSLLYPSLPGSDYLLGYFVQRPHHSVIFTVITGYSLKERTDLTQLPTHLLSFWVSFTFFLKGSSWPQVIQVGDNLQKEQLAPSLMWAKAFL